jgi:hypothetical protein
VEELLPDDPLELRDLLADSRLGVAQLARSTAELSRARDGFQSRKMSKVDAEPIISTHDGNKR